MRAVLCKEHGPPESLVMVEIPSPPCGAGQVRIAVHACGVNFPDTLIIQNKYQFKPPLPFTPGGEVAGEIVGRERRIGGEVGQRLAEDLDELGADVAQRRRGHSAQYGWIERNRARDH